MIVWSLIAFLVKSEFFIILPSKTVVSFISEPTIHAITESHSCVHNDIWRPLQFTHLSNQTCICVVIRFLISLIYILQFYFESPSHIPTLSCYFSLRWLSLRVGTSRWKLTYDIVRLGAPFIYCAFDLQSTRGGGMAIGESQRWSVYVSVGDRVESLSFEFLFVAKNLKDDETS